MAVQPSCGQPLFKENCFIFQMLLYELFIGAGPIAHFGCPLFESWLKACSLHNDWPELKSGQFDV